MSWCTPGLAASGEAGQRFSIVFLNTQFLPSIAAGANKRPNASYRAQAMVDRLATYDIVALCEVFEDSARRMILDGFRTHLGQSFHAATPRPEDRSAFGIDSGIVVVAHMPLESHAMRYGNDSSPLDYGIYADGFASKGALHVRLAAGSPVRHELDLIVTHLESKSDPIRRKQYAMLADFAAQHSSPNRPLVICGDMNTRGDPADRQAPQSSYRTMIASLRKAKPGLVDLLPESPNGTSEPESPSGGRRIDYILLANPPHGAGLRPIRIHVDHLDDPKVRTLSDHAAVCGEFEWTRGK